MAITKDAENVVTIKVIGIGGAGSSAFFSGFPILRTKS